MERIKLNDYFYLDEYIPKNLYQQTINKKQLIKCLNKDMLKADLFLREIFGVTIINTWWYGGNRNWSGVRVESSPYFMKGSQHTLLYEISNKIFKIKKQCAASDKLYSNFSSKTVQSYVKEHWKELGIHGLEVGVSWVHTDVRKSNKLITFSK